MTGKQRTLAAVWGGSRGAVTSPGGGAGSPADSAPSRKRDRDEVMAESAVCQPAQSLPCWTIDLRLIVAGGAVLCA